QGYSFIVFIYSYLITSIIFLYRTIRILLILILTEIINSFEEQIISIVIIRGSTLTIIIRRTDKHDNITTVKIPVYVLETILVHIRMVYDNLVDRPVYQIDRG